MDRTEIFRCVLCRNEFSRPVRRGRKPQYCENPCKRPKIRSKKRYPKKYESRPLSVESKCQVCDERFVYERKGAGRRRKTCSPDCWKEAKKDYSKKNRHKYQNKPHARGAGPRKIYNKVCMECARDFTATNKPTRYCSDCVPTILKRAGTKQFEAVLAQKRRICARPECGKSFLPSKPSASQRRDWYVQQHCSRECARGHGGGVPSTGPHSRKSTLTNTIKLMVLERDGWRCHICSKIAPKRLRGTTDDRAPEVEHIISVNAGGTDDPWNLRCAHRKCNRDKDRASFGQLLLPGVDGLIRSDAKNRDFLVNLTKNQHLV